jgi:predicted DNA-binding transcriptional regulator AlpA
MRNATSPDAVLSPRAGPTEIGLTNAKLSRKRPLEDRERRKPVYICNDPLLTAKEAATERNQGISTFWRDVKAGKVPPAYYINEKSPRWRLSELRASIEATRKAPAPAREADAVTT